MLVFREHWPFFLFRFPSGDLALFSSGSDPHSTLLGFCSIHFNSIQDALQHAKRLGWAQRPPRHAHRPPTPCHPGPRAQHPWCLPQHLAFHTMPCAPRGAGGESGQGVAGGRAEGKLGPRREGGSWAGGVALESCPVQKSLGVARWTGLGSDAGSQRPVPGASMGGRWGPGRPPPAPGCECE